MNTPFLLAAAALLFATQASAQKALPTAPQPTGVPIAAVATSRPGLHPQVLPGGSSVTYFTAVASTDAQHAQFALLKQVFEAAMPTVVLYEGLDCGTEATEKAAIAGTGAAGYVRFLAQQYEVPTEPLNCQPAEYDYLFTKTDPEQLKLYYLLQAVQRLQRHPDASKALSKKAMTQLITNSYSFVPGTEHVIRNLAELRAAYRRHCPKAGKWWQAPAAYCTVGNSSATAPYPFLKTINQELALFRQQYQAGRVAAHAQAGQRVLVVVVPGYEPAQPGSLASTGF